MIIPCYCTPTALFDIKQFNIPATTTMVARRYNKFTIRRPVNFSDINADLCFREGFANRPVRIEKDNTGGGII